MAPRHREESHNEKEKTVSKAVDQNQKIYQKYLKTLHQELFKTEKGTDFSIEEMEKMLYNEFLKYLENNLANCEKLSPYPLTVKEEMLDKLTSEELSTRKRGFHLFTGNKKEIGLLIVHSKNDFQKKFFAEDEDEKFEEYKALINNNSSDNQNKLIKSFHQIARFKDQKKNLPAADIKDAIDAFDTEKGGAYAKLYNMKLADIYEKILLYDEFTGFFAEISTMDYEKEFSSTFIKEISKRFLDQFKDSTSLEDVRFQINAFLKEKEVSKFNMLFDIQKKKFSLLPEKENKNIGQKNSEGNLGSSEDRKNSSWYSNIIGLIAAHNIKLPSFSFTTTIFSTSSNEQKNESKSSFFSDLSKNLSSLFSSMQTKLASFSSRNEPASQPKPAAGGNSQP